jgi:diaminohydroxyphosphoribosylaminopyrimidine deaminase/5-amino-6-(5-phosphoribosylamino)uracil reductase
VDRASLDLPIVPFVDGAPERSWNHIVTPIDRIYLARACELAARGVGNVSPNPPVGAVIVSAGGRILGEGYHHGCGEAHAEVEALRDAERRGNAETVAGASVYVTLEPCNHQGRTPPCSEAVAAAKPARVVIGALDPNPRTAMGGVTRLREAGILVEIADDAWARELIRRFSRSICSARPYVTLKMAASLDGLIAPAPGSFWLTGAEARTFVGELRHEHDAVLVGARTVAIDDPILTIRPSRTRRRPFVRIVLCGATPPKREARIFAHEPATETLLLVPGAAVADYEVFSDRAKVLPVGGPDARSVDLPSALLLLREREIASVLCEGGPTLAAAMLTAHLVDRIEWLVAPRILTNAHAVRALNGELAALLPRFRFDAVEPLGDDLRLTVDLAAETLPGFAHG